MNFASKLRKVMTTTVAAATIASSMGLSALTASAATPASGSLIKASLPTVYFLGADNKRYVFPNQDTYKTWYADFSSVQTITDTELAALPLGGNVTMRPGVSMIKITTDPKVYAVAKGGVLRWIKTEAAAQALYGSTWSKSVKDVADSFFTNYTIGSDIASSADFMPATEMANSASINVDKNLVAGGTTTTVSGTLTATMSAAQPVGGYLPKGATGVTMVKVDVRNGGSTATTIDSMTVARTGLGASTDFAAAYIYEGVNRLTTARSFSTTNDFTVGGLNLALAAGETKTLSVVADMASGAATGNVNSVKVNAIASGSAVAAGLPISGPSFTLTGTGVAGVTVKSSGTITAPKAGSIAAKVAEFKIANDNTEDVVLNKVALYYAGSITRTSLTNLVLKQNGTTLSSVAGLNAKDQAVFVLSSPFAMNKGVERTFEVYADFSGTTRTGYTETIKFYVEEGSDIAVTGTTTGYGSTVTKTTYDGDNCVVNSSTGVGSGDCSATYLDGGQVTLSFNGPSAGYIASNAKDVELFNFTMAAASNIEVKKTVVILNSATSLCSASAAYLTDVKIVDVATGATVTNSRDVLCSASTTTNPTVTGSGASTTQNVFTFSDVYNLTAGQSKTMKVTADVSSAVTADKDVTVTVQAFGSSDIKNTDNNTNVTDIVPSGNLIGKKQTTQVATVAMTSASTPATGSKYVIGSANVALLGISLKAGDATDVQVNSIRVVASSIAAARNAVSTASLWNGATQVGDLKSPDTSGAMTFSNLNVKITKGAQVTLVLKGNLAGSATGLPYSNLHFDVAAADLMAVDAENNDLTIASGITGPNVNIIDGGSVTIVKASDDTESEAGLVLAGGTNIALAKYKFNAVDEEMKLTKVRFTVSSLAGSNVKSLSLYNGATLVGAAVNVDSMGIADFSGVSFVIPKDGNATLTVKGELASVGTGITSGKDVAVTLDNASGKLEIVGTGSGSGTKLTESNDDAGAGINLSASGTTTFTDLSGNSKIVRKTKPTVSLVALPSSTLIASDVTVARFKVTADNMGDVSLKKITVQVTDGIANSATLSNWKLRRTDTGTDVTLASAPATLSGGTFSGTVVFTLNAEEVITANSSKTFDVITTLDATLTTSDSLSAKVLGDSALNGSDANSSAAGNFVWSDGSATSHSETTLDWNNGTYVKTLPTDSQTLTK